MTIHKVLIVFKAYVKAELLRNRGFLYAILSLSLWLMLFLAPIMLFMPQNVSKSYVASCIFVAIAVFLAYTMATWDWAWQLRWLINNGVFEYVLASGSSIFILYAGVVPVSLIWYMFTLVTSYYILSFTIAKPELYIKHPLVLVISVLCLFLVLMGYSMLLGAVAIASGSAGPILEFLGWIMPIATGGITPLSTLPREIQLFALSTPFSYPAELLRFSLGISRPIIDPSLCIAIAILYSSLFLLTSISLFRHQLKKLLKEGIKSMAMI